MAYRDKQGVKTEHVEQSSFVMQAYFEFPNLILFAVANGGGRELTEAIRLKAEGVLAGVPDVVVEEARGGWFGLRIEFKKTSERRKVNGGLSDKQLALIPKIRAKGYRVVVCYGADEGLRELRHYMQLRPTVSLSLG